MQTRLVNVYESGLEQVVNGYDGWNGQAIQFNYNFVAAEQRIVDFRLEAMDDMQCWRLFRRPSSGNESLLTTKYKTGDRIHYTYTVTIGS